MSFDGATKNPDDDVKPLINDPALDLFLDDLIAESVPSSTHDPRNTFQKKLSLIEILDSRIVPVVYPKRTLFDNRRQNKGHTMTKSKSNLSFQLRLSEKRDETFSVFRLSKKGRFYFIFFVIPIMISLLYAVAIMFPPEARAKAPLFLWTPGALSINEDGKYSICLRESICSEGVLQILLIFLSRATAFASYVIMGATCLSKMHCFNTWLSFTYVSAFIPIEELHKIHKKSGAVYFVLIILHVIGHGIRWAIRQETMIRTNTTVGLSGLIAAILMMIVVLSMSPLAKSKFTFETRLDAHYLMTVFALALCFHTPRCRTLTLIFL